MSAAARRELRKHTNKERYNDLARDFQALAAVVDWLLVETTAGLWRGGLARLNARPT